MSSEAGQAWARQHAGQGTAQDHQLSTALSDVQSARLHVKSCCLSVRGNVKKRT